MTERLTHSSTTCPYCHANLQGSPIPEQDRHLFGDKTHFSRIIGIEDSSYDGVSHWRCPDCSKEDSRFLGMDYENR